MTSDEYLELGRHVWRTYVPKRGQSDTVQGELLRASEKLRDECHRNGNMNWDEGHEILAKYILDTLMASPDISRASKVQLGADIDRILDFEYPCTDDEPFDRVERLILDWCHLHPAPVSRELNPHLRR